jgi:hypothetical protein
VFTQEGFASVSEILPFPVKHNPLPIRELLTAYVEIKQAQTTAYV